MSYFKHIARHLAIYSISVLMGRLLSILLLPVYTRYLSPADYGVLELLEFMNQVLTALVGANLGSALMFYSSKQTDEEGRRTVVQTTTVASHGLGCILGVSIWLIANKLSETFFGSAGFSHLIRVSAVTYGFIFAQEAGLAYLRFNNRSTRYTALLLIKQLLTAACNLFMIVYLGWGPLSFVVSSAVCTILLSLYLDTLILRLGALRIRLELLPQMLRYSIPLAWSAIGMTFIHSGDRFFLQRYAGLSDVGLYGLGYKFGTLAGYIQPTFETYWNAQMFRITSGIDGNKRYVRTLTYLFLVSVAAAVAVSLASQPMVILMAEERFRNARFYAPLIAGAYAIRSAGDYFKSVFALHGKTTGNLQVTAVGALVAAASYGLLIPMFGAWGAAFATFLTFASMAFVAFRQAQKVEHHDFEWLRLFKIAASGSLCIALSPALSLLPLAWQFVVAGLGTCLFPVLLWMSGFFEQEEKTVLRALLGKIRSTPFQS